MIPEQEFDQTSNVHQTDQPSKVTEDSPDEVTNETQRFRISLGLCPSCGIQTHFEDQDGKIHPVTNEYVFRSRCLLCFPIDKDIQKKIRIVGEKYPLMTSLSSSKMETNYTDQTTPQQHSAQQFQDGWDHFVGDHHKAINRKLGQSLIVCAMYYGNQVAKGFCHLRGWGDLALDHSEAFQLFEESASRGGDANALAMVGYCYRHGCGTDANFRQAVIAFTTASKRKNSWAMTMLAMCYSEYVDREFDKAFRLYKKAAQMGNAKAMFDLAGLYHKGVGVERDLRESQFWYRKAAELNYTPAKAKVQNNENGIEEFDDVTNAILSNYGIEYNNRDEINAVGHEQIGSQLDSTGFG